MRLKNINYLFVLALMAALCGNPSTRAEAENVGSKYTLISAYIYNFTQLTSWPQSAVRDVFTVCVVGSDPFDSNLDPLESRKVNDVKIVVKHRNATDGDLSACNVLYVSGSERGNLKDILKPLKSVPVLTMSDIGGFSNSGGMIEFKLEDGKINIWVALSQVRVTGLSISSKLLNLENMNIR